MELVAQKSDDEDHTHVEGLLVYIMKMTEYEINDRQRVFLNGQMYRKQLKEIRFSGNSVLIGNEPYPASDWYRNSLVIEFIKRMMKIKELISNHLWVDYLLEHPEKCSGNYTKMFGEGITAT